jgi:hypothetical protein
MSFLHARIAVDATTPVLVSPTNADTSYTIQVQNLGSNATYLGGAGLTATSYGASIVAGGAVTIDNLAPKDQVYALSSSGTAYVAVLMIVR